MARTSGSSTTDASSAAGTDFATKFQLPHTQSAQALQLLQKEFPTASGTSDQIVMAVKAGLAYSISGPGSSTSAEVMRMASPDASTVIGRHFNRLFVGLLGHEFGPRAFRVERNQNATVTTEISV